MAVTAWSYSRYRDFEQCPAKFRFKYVDKLPEPDSPAQARGREVHKVAETYLKAQGPANDVPAPLSKFAGQARELAVLGAALGTLVVEQQWGFSKLWTPSDWFGHETWFRAVVDACVTYADGSATVIDFKTGKRHATNDEQMELFALAAMHRYPGVTAVETRLWYLDSGAEVVAEYAAHDVDELRDKWTRKVAPIFREKTWAPRPNDRCRWCAFAASAGGPCKFG